MTDKRISQLEQQLEHLVEGVFDSIFSKGITARDIALRLARSMEDNLLPPSDPANDTRSIAPDRYTISVHPDVHHKLAQKHPQLATQLDQQLVELAIRSGYQLRQRPVLTIIPEPTVQERELRIGSSHSHLDEQGTAAMQAVSLPQRQPAPSKAQIIVNSGPSVSLSQSVINIGRSEKNDVVITDPRVSRLHIQLRLRFGAYVLFDAQSTGGTYVNNIKIKEHRLQSGDVIRIGNTQMTYMDDNQAPIDDISGTDVMESMD